MQAGLRLAELLQEDGDWVQGEAVLRHLLAGGVDAPRVKWKLGKSLYGRGAYVQAAWHLNGAVRAVVEQGGARAGAEAGGEASGEAGAGVGVDAGLDALWEGGALQGDGLEEWREELVAVLLDGVGKLSIDERYGEAATLIGYLEALPGVEIEEYREVIVLVRLGYARQLAASGRLDEALLLLNRISGDGWEKTPGQSGEVIIEQARIYLSLGMDDQAKMAFSRFASSLDSPEQQAAAWSMAALMYVVVGSASSGAEFQEAACRTEERQDGDAEDGSNLANPGCYLALARMYGKAARGSSGEGDKAGESSVALVTALEKYRRALGNSAKAYMQAGKEALSLGVRESAIGFYVMAVEQEPANQETVRAGVRGLAAAGDRAGGAELLETWLGKHAVGDGGRGGRGGGAAARSKGTTNVDEDLLNKEPAKKLFFAAEEFRLLGDLSRASALYSTAARLNPARLLVHLRLARVLGEQGRWSEMDHAFARYVSLSSHDGAQAYQNVARELIALGDKLRAVSYLEKAVQIDPTSLHPRIELAGLYGELGQLDNEEAELVQIALLSPNPGTAMLHLARAYLERDENGLALGVLARLRGERERVAGGAGSVGDGSKVQPGTTVNPVVQAVVDHWNRAVEESWRLESLIYLNCMVTVDDRWLKGGSGAGAGAKMSSPVEMWQVAVTRYLDTARTVEARAVLLDRLIEECDQIVTVTGDTIAGHGAGEGKVPAQLSMLPTGTEAMIWLLEKRLEGEREQGQRVTARYWFLKGKYLVRADNAGSAATSAEVAESFGRYVEQANDTGQAAREVARFYLDHVAGSQGQTHALRVLDATYRENPNDGKTAIALARAHLLFGKEGDERAKLILSGLLGSGAESRNGEAVSEGLDAEDLAEVIGICQMGGFDHLLLVAADRLAEKRELNREEMFAAGLAALFQGYEEVALRYFSNLSAHGGRDDGGGEGMGRGMGRGSEVRDDNAGHREAGAEAGVEAGESDDGWCGRRAQALGERVIRAFRSRGQELPSAEFFIELARSPGSGRPGLPGMGDGVAGSGRGENSKTGRAGVINPLDMDESPDSQGGGVEQDEVIQALQYLQSSLSRDQITVRDGLVNLARIYEERIRNGHGAGADGRGEQLDIAMAVLLALAYEQLGADQEEMVMWGEVLRLQPSNVVALSKLVEGHHYDLHRGAEAGVPGASENGEGSNGAEAGVGYGKRGLEPVYALLMEHGNQPGQWASLARLLVGDDDGNKAIQAVDQAILAADGADSMVLQKLGFLLDSNRHGEAMDVLQDLFHPENRRLQAFPPFPQTWLKAAGMLQQAGLNNEAGTLVMDGIRMYPADTRLAGAGIGLLLKEGNYGRAAEVFRSVAGKSTIRADSLFPWNDLVEAGLGQEVASHLEKQLEDTDKSGSNRFAVVGILARVIERGGYSFQTLGRLSQLLYGVESPGVDVGTAQERSRPSGQRAGGERIVLADLLMARLYGHFGAWDEALSFARGATNSDETSRAVATHKNGKGGGLAESRVLEEAVYLLRRGGREDVIGLLMAYLGTDGQGLSTGKLFEVADFLVREGEQELALSIIQRLRGVVLERGVGSPGQRDLHGQVSSLKEVDKVDADDLHLVESYINLQGGNYAEGLSNMLAWAQVGQDGEKGTRSGTSEGAVMLLARMGLVSEALQLFFGDSWGDADNVESGGVDVTASSVRDGAGAGAGGEAGGEAGGAIPLGNLFWFELPSLDEYMGGEREEVLLQVARALHVTGRHEDAARVLMPLVSGSDRDTATEAHRILVVVAQGTERRDELVEEATRAFLAGVGDGGKDLVVANYEDGMLLDKAIQMQEEIIKVDPGIPDSYLALLRMKVRNGCSDSQLDGVIDSLLDTSADSVAALLSATKVLKAGGKFDYALSLQREAVRKKPGNVRLLMEMIDSGVMVGDRESLNWGLALLGVEVKPGLDGQVSLAVLDKDANMSLLVRAARKLLSRGEAVLAHQLFLSAAHEATSVHGFELDAGRAAIQAGQPEKASQWFSQHINAGERGDFQRALDVAEAWLHGGLPVHKQSAIHPDAFNAGKAMETLHAIADGSLSLGHHGEEAGSGSLREYHTSHPRFIALQVAAWGVDRQTLRSQRLARSLRDGGKLYDPELLVMVADGLLLAGDDQMAETFLDEYIRRVSIPDLDMASGAEQVRVVTTIWRKQVMALERCARLAALREEYALSEWYAERLGKHLPGIVEDRAFLADLREKREDFAWAAQAYEEALAVFPHSPLLKNNLAYVLANWEQRLDHALIMVRESLRAQPEGAPFYLDTEGWILFKMGDLKGAHRSLSRAVALFDDLDAASAESFYHLGVVQKALGMVDEAFRTLNVAWHLDPHGEIGKQAQEVLETVIVR